VPIGTKAHSAHASAANFAILVTVIVSLAPQQQDRNGSSARRCSSPPQSLAGRRIFRLEGQMAPAICANRRGHLRLF